MTTRDLLTECFQDLTILGANETLSDTDAAFGLNKLTRLFDNWNAERAGVYAIRFTTYTLVPNLQPHTIGPATSSPTFTVTQRPVSIESARLVIGTSFYPLKVRTAEWWSRLTFPSMATSMPTDVFYSADWPLGQLFLYPVPTSAYGLELQTRIVLADLALTDTVSLPPGYRDAVTLTLGEMIAPSYPPATADAAGASKARARIFANNDVTPTLATIDAGTGHGRRCYFDYRSGLWR